MTAAHLLVGAVLPGERISGDGGFWTVIEKIVPPANHSPGIFSVGYRVEHSNGTSGFLKALDYAAAFQQQEVPLPVALAEMTQTFNAEGDLIDQCGNARLDRVVRGLGKGSYLAPGADAMQKVDYIILEMATGDVRKLIDMGNAFDQLVMLRVAHHAAVGMNQLHSIQATHQDVKPGNVLYWDTSKGPSGKLGDLGRAHSEHRPAPHDAWPVAGDPAHAAPEGLYGSADKLPRSQRRYAADFYMLGNLICYLVTGRTYGTFLYSNLSPQLHWRYFSDTFDNVLPGLLNAHVDSIAQIKATLQGDHAEEIIKIIDELCHPNPLIRGDKVARRQGSNPYRLQRFVSRLDCVQLKASNRIGRM